eukprot:6002093-Prymnesium_polylepis.1
MIKLFSLKQEKAAEDQASAAGTKKIAPGLIRMQKGGGLHRTSQRPYPPEALTSHAHAKSFSQS